MSAAEETKPIEAVAVEAPAQVEEPAKIEETAKEETEAEAKPVESQKKEAEIIKTTAQIDQKTYANNVKFDASLLKETDDPVEIRKQVEFYLSDSNLPHDKFLWELVGGFDNKPIPLKTITNFKRMRRFQPYSSVVAALKESKQVDIAGEEGDETIQRKQAYTSGNDKFNARCVYVKGFGDEEPSTQFDLEAFFNQYGTINSVRLRRTNEKLFKGSVFVEFPNEEAAQKFLALDPKPKWKDHDLKMMPKIDYVKEKSALIHAGKLEPNSSRRFFEGKEGEGRGGRGGGRGRGGRGGNFGKDDWKQRRDHDQKNGFRGGRGGRGGRGRGRGGDRRGGRDNRDNRENRRDPNEVTNDRNAYVSPYLPSTRDNTNPSHSAKPTIQATNGNGEAVAEDKNSNGKRGREEDGAAQPEAKKVDTKADVAA
ncbi:La domain-containing protein [Colletotrichum orchidophilum]|uniref:La domain-containing protein n=1 Tax=Colletotrichum orchidophilum TaxID=1209926 RepID=A0A1G4B781_9PEZI|nr:La domain-containing protein [Colletotrichum orchidophilum]OHE97310.1 La domain-containing protein [Colletotrichum orchidophilum]